MNKGRKRDRSVDRLSLANRDRSVSNGPLLLFRRMFFSPSCENLNSFFQLRKGISLNRMSMFSSEWQNSRESREKTTRIILSPIFLTKVSVVIRLLLSPFIT